MAEDPSGTGKNPYSVAIRLLLIPFLVYLAWLIEVWLLAGRDHLDHPEPGAAALYTVIACILTGMVIPILLVRKAFSGGTVNMFQIGFRSPRRTIAACAFSLLLLFGMVLFLNPFGSDRIAFGGVFLLLFPTAAASVMICWVLCGTHLQAFVRGGGVPAAVTIGTVVTGLLFAISTLALRPSILPDGSFAWPLCAGIGGALFFFAIRDVYATVIVMTGAWVLIGPFVFQAVPLSAVDPMVFASSGLAFAALALIHLSLAISYRTVMVIPDERPKSGGPGQGTV